MGFFQTIEDFVFGKPITINDPVFGKLEFAKRFSHWNGLEYFPLGADKIRVTVDAGLDGPSAEQRERFREFVLRWAELRRQITPLAFEELKGWVDGSREWYAKNNDKEGLAALPELVNFEDAWNFMRVSFVAVTSKAALEGDITVGIEFWYITGVEDNDHIIHAFIRNWQVSDVQIEG